MHVCLSGADCGLPRVTNELQATHASVLDPTSSVLGVILSLSGHNLHCKPKLDLDFLLPSMSPVFSTQGWQMSDLHQATLSPSAQISY